MSRISARLTRALLAVLCCAIAAAQPFASDEARGDVLRIGISSFTQSNPNNPVIEQTIAELYAKLGRQRLRIERLTLPELESAVRAGRLDFFLSSSGFYRRMLSHGVKDLATLVSPPFNNPNTQEASTIIVRADRAEIRELADLRGLTVAANLEESFSGFQIGLAEFARLTANPETFFSRRHFVGRRMEAVIERVLAGREDAGILRRCFLEEYAAAHPDFSLNAVRVLNEKGPHPCRYSTDLYPNWSFSATAQSDFRQTRELLAVVLGMKPTEDGMYWSVATDFSKVDALMRSLRIGPYEFLRQWNWKRLLVDYWPAAALVVLLLAGLAVHGVLTERTVQRRTQQLQVSLLAQERLAEESEAVHQRLYQMQKLGTVGEISSLLVHELGQPVGAIRLYVVSLIRMLERGRGDPEKICAALQTVRGEVERVEGIVERVRSYVKGKKTESVEIDLAQAARRAADFAAHYRQKGAALVLDLEPDVRILGDRVDVELALLNLLKNAFEAALNSPAPAVAVAVRRDRDGKRARVIISDNGPRLSEKEFASVSEVFHSTKAGGLGLGLSIVRSIVERHGGNLGIGRGQGDGLVVELYFPLLAHRSKALGMSDRVPDKGGA
ncbi:MAG: PhnD/SsuA/transferrin family substrate-binding protein [Duodenibacillus sp.]|nr:PhnD/SsuA/transferrin family substrate-binding protein [Duodenibacillus sp.]